MTPPFTQGNIYQCTGEWTSGGDPIDPDTVEFVYYAGNYPSSQVTLTYDGASEPAPGVVARTGVGVYVAQVDLTNIAEPITRWFQSPSGVGQAASGAPFVVTVTELPVLNS